MTTTKKVGRDMDGLREALFDSLEKLLNGEIEATQAKAVATIALTVIKSVEVQIEYERLRIDSKVPAALPNMPLQQRLPKAVA